jgi:hypothetical protein
MDRSPIRFEFVGNVFADEPFPIYLLSFQTAGLDRFQHSHL